MKGNFMKECMLYFDVFDNCGMYLDGGIVDNLNLTPLSSIHI